MRDDPSRSVRLGVLLALRHAGDPRITHTFDTGQPRAKARCLSKVLLGTRPDGVTVWCGPAARKHGCWRTGFVLTTRRRCPACKAPGGLRELLPFGTRN